MKLGSQARSLGLGIYPEERDFLGVVRTLGELGLSGLETNWKNLERYFGNPETFGDILDENGLSLIGAHCGGALADDTELAGLMETSRAVSHFVNAVSGEYVVFSCRQPAEDTERTWRVVAERLNEIGRICQSNGVMLACHNHWWESAGIGLDTLVRCTNPQLVGFAFDTGHHTRAGGDAAAAIRELGSRILLVHLADWDGQDRPPLGQGSLDLGAMRTALVDSSFDGWLVLEEQTEFGSATAQVAAALAVARQVAVGGGV